MFAATLLFSCAALGGEPKILELPYLDVVSSPNSKTLNVGTIPNGCAHVLNKQGKPAATPPGFSISPDEAMKRAIKANDVHCAGKPQTVRLVFANLNKAFYTILDYTWVSDHGPQTVIVHIDGHSGRIWHNAGKQGG